MTISQKLIDVNTAKTNIKAAIEAKGVDTTGVPFTNYHTKISEISGGGGGTNIVFDTWNRPSDWLTVPTITETSEEVYVLLAVNDTPKNSIMFVNDSSAITVDWGDGTVENYPAGSFCEHNYDFNNVALAATLTTRGYKQALIHITPQTTFTAGTLINFIQQPTGYRLNQNIPVLEIHFAMANGTLAWPRASITSNQSCRMFDLEYINIKAWTTTSLQDLCRGLTSLAKIDLPSSPTGGAYTTMFQAFDECYSLLEPPIIDTSSVTNFNYAFSKSGVQTIPQYDYSSATRLDYMFNLAKKLVLVPDMTVTASVTSMEYMFYTCESLIQAPNISGIPNTVTNFVSIFAYCYSLSYIPDTWNTAGVTRLDNTFVSCRSLTQLPNWDYSNVTVPSILQNCESLTIIPANYFQNGSSMSTTGASMFTNCYSLVNIPDNFTNVTIITSMDNMFWNCYSLQRIPGITIQSGQISGTIEFSDVFRQCFSLSRIGPVDLTGNTGITSLANIFNGAKSLQRIGVIGFNQTFTIADCNLDTAALDELFTNLATVTGKTITITGNSGAATCDTSIATAKGWTVVT